MCLLHWKIEKVFTITVDNIKSNDLAIEYLRRKINNWGGSVLNAKYLHVRCCGHILNLIVSDGLKEVKDSISRIREAVKQVRSSPSRKKKFKQCVELEKIPCKASVSLDVSTRWNSTYLMLDSTVKYQRAFERLYESYDKVSSELKKGVPTKEDWSVARILLQFLELFYWATLRLSGSKCVTANAYFHEVHAVETLINECLASNDSYVHSMRMKMKVKFDKYGEIS
ncbi:hypothetical protein Scep_004581 [Stephania cephalantha]|uniref:hAT-like transposase RNase-H fold domain-containing protein n=1 Tax=Stephania cephalantha TaxID=152367 RepID=A0AAP0KSR9_9MAGN